MSSQSSVNLASVDVVDFLERLLPADENGNPSYITNDGIEARYSCPYPAHGTGDRHPSAYMNMETTAFICFSCGATGNAITLLADLQGVPRHVAKNWIAQKWDPRRADIPSYRSHVAALMEEEPIGDQTDHPAYTILPESTVGTQGAIVAVDWANATAGWADYMRSRLSVKTLMEAGYVYDTVRDRPSITIRDVDGALVGFKGRAWRPEQDIKYLAAGDTPRMLQSYGVQYGFKPYDASRHLYRLHDADLTGRTLIIREGEINIDSMREKGFANVCGPSGSTLSDFHVRAIIERCEEAVIFFDTDRHSAEALAMSHAKIYKAIKSLSPYISLRVVGDHDGDPNEMSSERIASLLKEAKSHLRWQLDRSLASS